MAYLRIITIFVGMSNEKKPNNAHPYLAVIAVLAAIMMGVLDGTVMNVALPTLSKEFDVTPSNIIWVDRKSVV